MKADTILALSKFSQLVAMAIARNECGKDVNWAEVMEAQDELDKALDEETPENETGFPH